MHKERRVVITGMGVVTPVGNDLQTFWKNIKDGVSGIGQVTYYDTTEFDCTIAGEIRDFNGVNYFKNPKDVRRTDRYTQFAVAASKMALADAGIDAATYEDPTRFGVIVGSGIGGLKTLPPRLW